MILDNWLIITLSTAFDDHQRNRPDRGHLSGVDNPLAYSLSWKFEFYNRIKLFSWWLKYNIGIAHQAALKDKIVELATSMGLQDRWTNKILRHAVSEFSKKGLGPDYYGYHNIDHELEATYFALLALDGQLKSSSKDYRKFNDHDIKYLFVAALFHDYDPLKRSDKPHEESVEYFLRNDKKIRTFIDDIDISLDIVIAVIYRTTYPFKGKNAEYARKRMHDLFTAAGIQEDDIRTREHYEYLGWLLSVCERMAGYALGDYEHAKLLARRNAHALGWHPSFINEESVKYFSTLKEEKEMTQGVLRCLPVQFKKNFYDNVEAFREAWEDENRTRTSIRKKEMAFVCNVEDLTNGRLSLETKDSISKIYEGQQVPLQLDRSHFLRSLQDPNSILVTLRTKGIFENYPDNGSNDSYKGQIVGYVKGGHLEKYTLRRGTNDANMGISNTAYMEWICIKPGYWGEAGGHELRTNFLRQAKLRGFKFVTGYVHRSVIEKRISRGEAVEIVQKYDPDKLDYYRVDLSKTLVDIDLRQSPAPSTLSNIS